MIKSRAGFVIALLLACIAVYSCSAQTKSDDLTRLVSWMSGSFSSGEQAKVDTDYFDIRLKMTRIWKDRRDGYWLYVEQARGDKQERPYRQRVYHVTRMNENTFESAVFTLSSPLRFAGEWKKEKPLAQLTPDSLSKRDGCSILLKKVSEEAFEGSTTGKDCPSDLRGAAYATSEVKLWKDKLISWDRGWDKDGKQAWGAEKGGYVFLKMGEK